ncbi:MAG: PEP-CTERM sorting domain-containing protein [Planctomycetes bacterium]|nr:PEP-CTERM sorting domain-containing protein [Planctomycetota bacterium]
MARLLLIGLVGAALLVCSSVPARAAPIVADDFSYPDGPLAGNDGGTAGSGSSWSGPWATDSGGGWNVSGGQITADGQTADERYFSTGFSGSPATPFLYFSARFTASEGSDWDGPAMYLMEDATRDGLWFGLIWDVEEVGVLQPYVELFGGESATVGGSYSAGQEVLIVGKLEFNTGGGGMEQLQIWVNPTNVETGGQTHMPIIGDIGWTTPDLVYLESYSADSLFSFMDDVRIGTTWADVGPVPEPSTLLLLAAGLLGLLCYAWRKRK